MSTTTARAPARVGFLGNPSDLYRGRGVGGRGIGFALANFGVSVSLTGAPAVRIDSELLDAGWSLFRELLIEAGADPDRRPFELSFESDVPFQSGLSGSSALLVAALRAFSSWFEHPLAPLECARLAWRAEVEVLDVRAGPLDRLVQALGGLLAMDFERAFEPGSVERLDPALLPPMLVAWNPGPGEPSGAVHEPIWRRWESGDAEVRSVMAEIAAGAERGRAALAVGDRATLRALVDRNFDLRARLFPILPQDRRMIELGRELGAGTKFCGSGGSVLVVCEDAAHVPCLRDAYESAGFETLEPRVAEVCDG